jgi:deoxyadenosine/deoxycytidine kinase
MSFHHIAIEGPIGVGKTSLVRALAEKSNAHVVMENVDNPFLKDFYEERAGAAFRVQLFFLLNRYQQQLELAQRNLFQQVTISDYIFAKDKLFAYLNLTDNELLVYDRLYGLLEPQVPKQDLVIYLHATTDVLLARIKSRRRDFEREISADYINQVNEAYNHFFFHYKDTPLLVIDTSHIDFVHETADLDDLVERIASMGRGVQYYKPLPSEEK